ncbi:hypothetical protein C7447_10116 [Tenacibaculum adriaticum]|uniref:Lipoprotein n=1 Tax=Tenacibaculum adriaticum TaxID=413713 RepID=A0A5S5DTZ1_9FLAO|nr:hypothetical protein [Tenacibaculum adriaticum]TYP99420.1 hypothetical protein C7447_10116 [Tenacibaculum adriaticum]
MKKLIPFFIAFIFLASCSSEETIELDETLLKSYKITKNEQGRYSIDYEVKEDASVDVVKDIKTNYNEIYLFSGKVAMGNKRSESLSIENDQLKVGFFENNQKRKSVIIEDDNIVLAKGEESSEFLEQYSVEDLGDENYQLNFKVRDGVNVVFVYNELEDIYEVHLKEGKSNGVSFSKTYSKTSEVLKIDFVNYSNNFAKATESNIEKMPRVVIITL